jgi:hypothetical protein
MHGLEFYFPLLKRGGEKSYSRVIEDSEISKDRHRVDFLQHFYGVGENEKGWPARLFRSF